MKIDFNQPLVDFTGEPILLAKDGPQATLKDLSIISIKNPIQEDAAAPYADKLDLANMGEAIFNGVDITTPQASKLKERICKFFPSPAIAFAVEKAIEG